MSLPRQFIQDLQDRLVLSEVIGKRVKVIRAGREYKACCPFHHEKTPSFTINNEKGFYHCFGCGAHGDAIKFVQEHDNLTFREAVEVLAGDAGMSVPRQSKEERQKEERNKTLYDVVEAATAFFENTLRQDRDALSYLLDRGLSQDTIQHFRLGYAPAESQKIITFLLGKGFSHQQMVDAGIIRASTKKQGEYYSFFRERIMFPVTDVRGRIVAFGGRILPAIAARMTSQPPKYINSSDTVLFHKGKTLYNLSNARSAVSKDTPFIVVEGYMDVIALAQAGYKTAVAPLGTALTETQVDVLWRVVPEDCRVPVMCFDGDNAGRRAAVRAMERMLPYLKPDHSACFSFLPDGEDPDSLIQSKGKQAFDQFIQNSEGLSDLLWQNQLDLRPGHTPEERAGLKQALHKKLEEIENVSVRKAYMGAMNNRFYEYVRSAGRRAGYTQKSFANPMQKLAPVVKTPRPIRSNAYDVEHYFLSCLINYPELFDELESVLGKLDIQDQDLKTLRQDMFDIFAMQDTLDSQELKDILENTGYGMIIDALCSESLYLQATFARPGQNLEDVRQGLSFTVSRMRKRKKIG